MIGLLIELVMWGAVVGALAISVATTVALWRTRPVLAVDDPTEDLMGVARTVDVQPEATHCGHCKKPPRDHLTAYCAMSRTIEAFHYCCPSGCELGPAGPAPAPPVADVPPTAPPKMAASTPAATPQRDPHPGRPYAMGGWADVGGVRVHRACSDARRDGRRICTYCQPILVGPASELPR